MPHQRILAIVQAGGAGSRMDVLTRERAKPALPFAGIYQLIDFSLSNIAHSGITDVWLSVQFQGSTLEEQVSNGRPWDLDRNRGGLRLLMPQEGTGSTDEEGFATGNADELYRLRDQIRDADPAYVVVMSADHVTSSTSAMPSPPTTAGADCTVVTTEVESARPATTRTYRSAATDGSPASSTSPSSRRRDGGRRDHRLRPDILVETLEQLHRELAADSPRGRQRPGRLRRPSAPPARRAAPRGGPPAGGLLAGPRRAAQVRRAHRDLLLDDLGVLGDPDWPILTHLPPRVPARVLDGGSVVDSLLSPGCRIAGTVVRSVLGPGVVVEPGATVRDSVVFTDTLVQAGATVDWAVVDRHCTIESDSTVGAPADELGDGEGIVLVGLGSRVPAGAAVEPGARLEPGSTG